MKAANPLSLFPVNVLPVSFGGSYEIRHPVTSTASPSDGLNIVDSVMALGSLLGTITFHYLTKRFGRKQSLFINALLLLISWALLPPSDSLLVSLMFSIISGLSAGGISYLTPIFFGEIGNAHIRGILTSSVVLMTNIGISLMFILNELKGSKEYCSMFLLFPTICLSLIFIFVPRTRSRKLKSGKCDKETVSEGEKDYKCYSCIIETDQITQELEKSSATHLQKEDNSSETVTGSFYEDLKQLIKDRPFLFGTLLIWLNQLFGLFALMAVAGSILKESESALSSYPNMSTLIVFLTHLMGSFTGQTSGLGIALALSGLSLHIYCRSSEIKSNETASWISIICFCFPMFSGNYGTLMLPILIYLEIFPERVSVC